MLLSKIKKGDGVALIMSMFCPRWCALYYALARKNRGQKANKKGGGCPRASSLNDSANNKNAPKPTRKIARRLELVRLERSAKVFGADKLSESAICASGR